MTARPNLDANLPSPQGGCARMATMRQVAVLLFATLLLLTGSGPLAASCMESGAAMACCMDGPCAMVQECCQCEDSRSRAPVQSSLSVKGLAPETVLVAVRVTLSVPRPGDAGGQVLRRYESGTLAAGQRPIKKYLLNRSLLI